MLSVVWLVLAVLVAVLLTMWVTFTLTRLDRLHARVDAAQAALDAQLVRRAAALLHLAEAADSGVPDSERHGYERAAQAALEPVRPAEGAARENAENAVGRAIADLAAAAHPLHDAAAAELREAATRVLIARRFYNDAVRDTRALRARRMPRTFHLAGRRAMPTFFDIDDTVPVDVLPSAAPSAMSSDPASQSPAGPSADTKEDIA